MGVIGREEEPEAPTREGAAAFRVVPRPPLVFLLWLLAIWRLLVAGNRTHVPARGCWNGFTRPWSRRLSGDVRDCISVRSTARLGHATAENPPVTRMDQTFMSSRIVPE